MLFCILIYYILFIVFYFSPNAILFKTLTLKDKKLLRHPLYQSISWRQVLNNNNNDNNQQQMQSNNDILPQTRVVWQLPPSFRKSLVRANSSRICNAYMHFNY